MSEHVDFCPNEGTVAAAECHLCIDARKPCWTTPKGNAFHLRSDCPALEKYRQHPKVRTTVLWAKGDGYHELRGLRERGLRRLRRQPASIGAVRRSSKLPHCAVRRGTTADIHAGARPALAGDSATDRLGST